MAGRCYGRLDLPLRPEWEDAVGALLPQLAGLRLRTVWSSPLGRCRRPAALLAEALSLPLRLDERLLELEFGAWEGQAWDDVPREALDRWAGDLQGFAPPGGESGQALLARVGSAASEIRAQAAPCLVVSHGGPLRVMGALLQGLPADLSTPAPPPGLLATVDALSGPPEA